MPAQNVAVTAVLTPVPIGGASVAGRRFGHHVTISPFAGTVAFAAQGASILAIRRDPDR